MAGKSKTLFDNAEKTIKSKLFEGDFGYATADGQVFAGVDASKRLQFAQNHAFKSVPALEIKKIEGSKKIKPSS